jgi:hypothetical protein
VYFDCEHIGDLDEGLMIQSFLDTTRVLLVGSFCILITNSPALKLSQWGAQNHLVIILPTTVAKGANDQGYMWLMRRIDRTDDDDDDAVADAKATGGAAAKSAGAAKVAIPFGESKDSKK